MIIRGPHEAAAGPGAPLPLGVVRVQPQGRAPAGRRLLQRAGVLVGRQEGRQAGGRDQPRRVPHRARLQDHVDSEQDALRVLHGQHGRHRE